MERIRWNVRLCRAHRTWPAAGTNADPSRDDREHGIHGAHIWIIEETHFKYWSEVHHTEMEKICSLRCRVCCF